VSAPVALTARLADGTRWALQPPVSLAPEMPLDGSGPRWFDAPPAHSWPHRVGSFSGNVLTGASCNCRNVQLTPHGSGTHTEGVGHLTSDEHHALRVIPTGLLPALLLRIDARAATDCGESADHPPQAGDRLLCAASVAAAWPSNLPFAPLALVLACHWDGEPPYLSRECAQWIVTRGIRHLIVELPSLDRLADEGCLTAHRIFFGLPRRAAQARLPLSSEALRVDATVTELAQVPDGVATGIGFVQIQVPPMQGDALPSRPLWYALAAGANS
jgi:kynurenine formamidase